MGGNARQKRKETPNRDENVRPSKKTNKEEKLQEDPSISLDHLRQEFNSILKKNSLPTTKQIESIITLLKEKPLHILLSQLKQIPSILLLAVQKGFDQQDGDSPTATLSSSQINLLSNALLTFVTESLRINDHQRTIQGAANSSSSKRPPIPIRESEKQLIKKATAWSFDVLTRFVTCQDQSTSIYDSEQLIATLQSLSSRQRSVVIQPQDTLDEYFRQEFCSLIKRHASELINSFLHSDHDQVTLRSLSFHLSYICNATNESTSNSPTNKIADFIKCLESDLPTSHDRESILHCVQYSSQTSNELSREACLPLLQLTRTTWSQYLKIVEASFIDDSYIKFEDETTLACLVGKLSALDVSKHWILMDQVRIAIANGKQPFSLTSWSCRSYYRAVLSATTREIRALRPTVASTSLSTREIAVHLRFPPFFSSLIKQIFFLDNCMRDGSSKELLHLKTARSIMEVIYSFFDLDSSLEISVNAHAFLLCIEEIIEAACWGWVVSRLNDDIDSTNDADITRLVLVISRIAVTLDSIRLPDGGLVDNAETLEVNCRHLQDFLRLVITENRSRIKNEYHIQVHGLVAFVIAAKICTGNNVFRNQFLTNFSKNERREVRRALECSQSFSHDAEFRRRCIKAIKSVADEGL